MRMVVTSIGIPGSGKTTAMRKLAEEYGLMYVCPDDIREELTGDMTNHSRDREVWNLARSRVAEALTAGKDVAVDATFTNPRTRQDFVQFLRTHTPAKLFGLVFDVPLATARKRNLGRTRVVSDEQLEMRHQHLRETPPSLAEGFDTLFTLAELAQLETALSS